MDHPKTLIEFMDLYPTEKDCWQAIFEHRWPQGFVCARWGTHMPGTCAAAVCSSAHTATTRAR